MTTDPETLAFYDRAATDYADRFAGKGKPDQDMLAFIAELRPGGLVLDLGCGPGRSAALLREAGFAIEAMDASEGMVRTARERYGVEARLGTFDDLDAVARYDGIWANFSLLHAPRAALPRHLAAIARALRPGGVLHLGLKVGEGEERDHLGRLYVYFTPGELEGLLDAAGFDVTGRREDAMTGMAGNKDPFVILRARLRG